MWQAPPIHVEIQPTGWLLDGGVPMLAALRRRPRRGACESAISSPCARVGTLRRHGDPRAVHAGRDRRSVLSPGRCSTPRWAFCSGLSPVASTALCPVRSHGHDADVTSLSVRVGCGDSSEGSGLGYIQHCGDRDRRPVADAVTAAPSRIARLRAVAARHTGARLSRLLDLGIVQLVPRELPRAGAPTATSRAPGDHRPDRAPRPLAAPRRGGRRRSVVWLLPRVGSTARPLATSSSRSSSRSRFASLSQSSRDSRISRSSAACSSSPGPPARR